MSTVLVFCASHKMYRPVGTHPDHRQYRFLSGYVAKRRSRNAGLSTGECLWAKLLYSIDANLDYWPSYLFYGSTRLTFPNKKRISLTSNARSRACTEIWKRNSYSCSPSASWSRIGSRVTIMLKTMQFLKRVRSVCHLIFESCAKTNAQFALGCRHLIKVFMI